MVEQRSLRYMIYLVLFMGLVGQMDVWLSLIETAAVPEILAFYLISRADFSFWQGFYGIIVFLVFFIGWFSDAFGRRRGILLLLLVMGIPSIFIGLFPFNFHLFLILYAILIMGTTSNLWEVPIAEEAPAQRRGLYASIAFLISVIPLSSTLGLHIVLTYGWWWGYGAMFFVMLFLLLLLYFMKEPQRWVVAQEGRGEKRLGVIEALRTLERKDFPYIIVATIVYLTWTLAFKIGTTWGGEFFVTVLSYSASEWRLVLSVAGLMLPISAIITGLILDKIGRTITMVIGTLGSVISFIGLGLSSHPGFYWGVYYFMAMLLAWIYVYVTEIFPTRVRSTSIGIAVTGSRAGYVLGPWIALALLVGYPTFFGALWITTGIIMLIPLITLLIKPYETKGKTLETIEEER